MDRVSRGVADLARGERRLTTPPTILVAEDDRAIRTVLVQALCRSGYQVRSTGSAAMLWRWIEEGEGNLVITDVILPDGSGLELLPKVHRVRPKLRVIIMSAHSTLTMAVNATQRGAFEYLPKPFELSAMLQSVGRALAEPEEIVASQSDREVDPGLALLGRSPAMQEIYRNIARLAPTDLTVMISGESGTGKELVARALHEHGRRRNGPFVAINMAAIPRDLIESELFGHERGAFTGADRRTIGRFEQAAGGTLFLDEIGDMPPEAQTRLLRVLQEGEFTPVGSRQKAQSNVRIVAATHRDLRASIGTGTFREDLFYRLNVAPIRLPPLRERLIDIPLLANTFLERAREAGLPFRRLSESALQRLATHRWPGNVRELENLILRLAVLSSSETISGSEISAELDDGDHGVISPAGAPHSDRLDLAVECYVRNLLAAPGDSADLHTRVLAEVERPLFRRVLAATRGNQIRAAAILGLNRNTLRKKLRDLDIAPRHEVG